jgi:hypothetical protein
MPKKTEMTPEELKEKEEEINAQIKELTDELEKTSEEDKNIPAKMESVELPTDVMELKFEEL